MLLLERVVPKQDSGRRHVSQVVDPAPAAPGGGTDIRSPRKAKQRSPAKQAAMTAANSTSAMRFATLRHRPRQR